MDNAVIFNVLISYSCLAMILQYWPFQWLPSMVDLIGRELRQTTEFAISMVLFLSAKDAVAVVIAVGKHNAVAVGVAIH